MNRTDKERSKDIEKLEGTKELKGIASAVMLDILQAYENPNNLNPRISKEYFIRWLKSKDCAFYEAIMGWDEGYFYDSLKKAGKI